MTNRVARAVLLTLLISGVVVHGAGNNSTEATNALNSGRSSRVILEVINRHFTRGKKIRSVYLRIFSDGIAECHTQRFSDEPDIVKRKVLAPEEFKRLEVILEQPELLSVKHRYELMYPVIDSWMEWEIKILHVGNSQKIEVAGFSPAAAKRRSQPYPDVLVKLGCSISKLRTDVYGDEQAAAIRSEDCNEAFGTD